MSILYDPLHMDNEFMKDIGYETFKTKEELFNDPIFDEINEQNRSRIEKLLSNSSTSSFGKCPRCKKEDNTLLAKQTRSADEPIDFFILCNQCGNRWRPD